jgi:hypothetical protein
MDRRDACPALAWAHFTFDQQGGAARRFRRDLVNPKKSFYKSFVKPLAPRCG